MESGEKMSKNLVIILGPHAVGKMTVGQELAKLTGLRLFHNHMSIELTRLLFDHSEKEWRVLNNVIRNTVFDLFAKGDFDGLIFTYMFAFDEPREYEYVQGIIDLFESNGAKCCVCELSADFDVRLERNKSENRLIHKVSKRDIEHSEAEMRATSQKYRLNSNDTDKIPFENYLKIDNTALPPAEVAQMIVAYFQIQ